MTLAATTPKPVGTLTTTGRLVLTPRKRVGSVPIRVTCARGNISGVGGNGIALGLRPKGRCGLLVSVRVYTVAFSILCAN